MSRSTFALLVSLGVSFHSSLPAAEVEFDWSNNYAVIIGVLKWQDPTLSSFSTEGRQDRALADTLRKLGMPQENMALLLDEQATRAGMLTALDAVARRARPGANLLFYYAGHGAMSRGRATFANYDCVSGRPDTAFDLGLITAVLRRSYRGARVFLAADCCHSGALMSVAKELQAAGTPAAALTSAAASNVSTGNWTFTLSLIDALRGDPLLDRNGDGLVSLGETAWEVGEAMKHCEMQMFGWGNYGIEQSFPLAKVDGVAAPHHDIPPPYSFRQFVEVKASTRWLKGRIADYADGKFAVRIQAYNKRPVVQVEADKLRAITFQEYPAGANLTVLWKSQEFKARAVRVVQGFHYVTYPGYTSDWDEWLLSNRIVGVYEEIAAMPRVQAQWGDKWWPAVIRRRDGDRFLVHFTGWDNSWDDWVSADRVKPGQAR